MNEPTLRKALGESLNANSIVYADDGWYARFTVEGDGKCRECTALIWNDDNGLCVRDTGHFYVKKNWSRYHNYEFEWAVQSLAHSLMNKLRYHFWPKKPSESIREWYQTACPDDPEGESIADVPFYQYLIDVARAGDYYVDGVDDSIVRQRIQAALDHVMDGKGDDLYDLWRE